MAVLGIAVVGWAVDGMAVEGTAVVGTAVDGGMTYVCETDNERLPLYVYRASWRITFVSKIRNLLSAIVRRALMLFMLA